MQSLKSRALEPTGSELAKMSKREMAVRLRASVWPAAPWACIDHIVHPASARHLSNHAERALDRLRQGDRRAAVAGGDDTDDLVALI